MPDFAQQAHMCFSRHHNTEVTAGEYPYYLFGSCKSLNLAAGFRISSNFSNLTPPVVTRVQHYSYMIKKCISLFYACKQVTI